MGPPAVIGLVAAIGRAAAAAVIGPIPAGDVRHRRLVHLARLSELRHNLNILETPRHEPENRSLIPFGLDGLVAGDRSVEPADEQVRHPVAVEVGDIRDILTV